MGLFCKEIESPCVLCFFNRDWKSQLLQLQQDVLKDNVPTANMINVVRGCALPSFARALKRKNFSAKHRLDVCFVDLAETSEGAIDNGGPTREFFRLLLAELAGSEVFEGPDYAKHLRLSTNGKGQLGIFAPCVGCAKYVVADPPIREV